MRILAVTASLFLALFHDAAHGSILPTAFSKNELSNLHSFSSRGIAPNELLNTTQEEITNGILSARRESYPKDGWVIQRNNDIVTLCDLQPGDNVLDIAAGVGTLVIAAKRKVGRTGNVVAVDLSDSMLQTAEREAAQSRADIRFLKHDINDMRTVFRHLNMKFDAITCTNAFGFYIKNRRSSLKLWSKYLKPGGRIILDALRPDVDPGIFAVDEALGTLGYPVPSSGLDSEEKMISLVDGTGLNGYLATTPSYKVGEGTTNLAKSMVRQQRYLAYPNMQSHRNTKVESLAKIILKSIYEETANERGEFEDKIGFWTLVLQRPD